MVVLFIIIYSVTLNNHFNFLCGAEIGLVQQMFSLLTV